MAQKANPNSFIKKKKIVFGGVGYTTEYASHLKVSRAVLSNLVFLFEKNRCFVKSCFFIQNNDRAFTTVFISFLVWKKRKLNKNVDATEAQNTRFTQGIFNVLSKHGQNSSKRLVLQNLNKLVTTYQNTIFIKGHAAIIKKLNNYRTEPYFQQGVMLFCLLSTTKNTSLVFAKFVAKFYKIFHRTRKINKFLRFLADFVESTNTNKVQNTRIKGLKIRIKGRFNGVPRSKTRVFEKGQIPLQTFKHDITYSLVHAPTSYGVFGVKVWVFE